MYKIRAAAKRRGDEGSSETLENMTTFRTSREATWAPDGSAAPFCESSLELLSMDVRPGARPILSQVRFRHVLDISRSVIGHRHPPAHTGPKQRAVVTSLKHVHILIQPLILQSPGRVDVRQHQCCGISTEDVSSRWKPDSADGVVAAEQPTILSPN